MTKRQSHQPSRRVAPPGSLTQAMLDGLAQRVRYAIGPNDNNGHHKLRPADYGFVPPVNPRASKSVCDFLRPIPAAKAVALFRAGLAAGMTSAFEEGSTPKYVWAVDAAGEVYEAKTHPPDVVYHGYRMGDDEQEMRRYIKAEWSKRCPKL